jgi:hypothetical protein
VTGKASNTRLICLFRIAAVMLLLAALVCRNLCGQWRAFFKMYNCWWEYGWPLVYMRRDAPVHYPSTSFYDSLPLDGSRILAFHPWLLVGDVIIAVAFTTAFACVLVYGKAGSRFSLRALLAWVSVACLLLACKSPYTSWPLHLMMLPIYLSLLLILVVVARRLFTLPKRSANTARPQSPQCG